MLQRLKHAIHVKGVSFGAMSLLLMHSWSLIPSQVNQIMHVPSTAQTAMDSLRQKYLLPWTIRTQKSRIIHDSICGLEQISTVITQEE